MDFGTSPSNESDTQKRSIGRVTALMTGRSGLEAITTPSHQSRGSNVPSLAVCGANSSRRNLLTFCYNGPARPFIISMFALEPQSHTSDASR